MRRLRGLTAIEEVPAHFMWRHKLAYGVANNVSI